MSKWVLGLLVALSINSYGTDVMETVIHNPTGREYKDEPVRLKVTPLAQTFKILSGNQEVPFQIEVTEDRKIVWICTSLAAGGSIPYRIEAGNPREVPPKVSIVQENESYVIDNELISIRIPAKAIGASIPGPILGIRTGKGTWCGSSAWNTSRKLKNFNSTIVGNGTVYAKVRLRYEFEGSAGIDNNVPAFAVFDISLAPGQQHAVIEESHEMSQSEYFEVELSKNWQPNECLSIVHSGGFDIPNPFDKSHFSVLGLKAGQSRLGETLLELMPRWNQHCDQGWYFAASDKTNLIGAMVCRAGKWFWPHDNQISARLKESGTYAGIRCPTWRGKRYWFLQAGVRELGNTCNEYVLRYGFEPLDKIANDYVTEWPGKTGVFKRPFFPFSESINPTGAVRGMAKGATGNAGKPGGLTELAIFETMFDPDCYGSYWLHWSPENPNFFTDFARVPIATTTRLKDHPQFQEFARKAEALFREDMYHSVTMPGGAGQECPGYQEHALKGWRELAEICKTQLGFDPTTWPRFQAAETFLRHLSQPDGLIRRFNPAGDTHPGKDGSRPIEVSADEVKKFTTEELHGFGMVFHDKPGTPQETYLSFKSGPNRGHYHGDQLAFHYCADARPLAVDHHCSYHPRAGQEHMHNRVSFSMPEAPFANMDGYERLIAYKVSPEVDAGIGQVESKRLRGVKELPPENWDDRTHLFPMSKPLTYRRSVIQIKCGGAQTYFVIRDQFSGPELMATYNLHVRSKNIQQRESRVEFDQLTLFCAIPNAFEFKSYPWSHENGTHEETQGAKLSIKAAQGQFITVLYPGDPGKTPTMSSIANGVKVGDDEVLFSGEIDQDPATAYISVKRKGQELFKLTGSEIDLNRSQGEVGLFVPDAGYPFGDIPDWLIKQRMARPADYIEMGRGSVGK